MIRESIVKIVENGKTEDMKKMADMLDKTIEMMKENSPEKYKEYKICLYEMANGEVLNDEMKEEWVKNMRPLAKWTKEDIENVASQYELKEPIMSAYVIMNMLYSDDKKKLVYGSGDNEESIEKYVEGTNNWYFDEDTKKDGEAKLYNYWKYIIN